MWVPCSIGAHVDQTDPLAEAATARAPLVQFFLGDPQSYQGPEIRYAGGADGLRDDAVAAGVDLYVHAPYIVNVATTNNRIRIPSRKLLQQHVDAAASIGAKGLIVHGGHVSKDDDPAVGFDNWRKAVDAVDLKLPLLIENTAGGDHAMTRYLERIRASGRPSPPASRPTWSASASTPATPTPGGNPPETSSTTSARSPAGSTWSTATTAATSSTPAPTGTPASAPAGSTPTCWRRSSATPTPRWSARPRAAPPSTPPTSTGCEPAGCRLSDSLGQRADRPDDLARGPPRSTVRSRPSVSFLQTPAWARAKPEWRPESLGCFRDGEVVGAALVLYRQLPRLRRYLAYLPEGPVIDWESDDLAAWLTRWRPTSSSRARSASGWARRSSPAAGPPRR